VSRPRDDRRLRDVVASIEQIGLHLRRGPLDDGLVYDAIRMRLLEVGEAVKDVSPERLASEPHIPWRDVARIRDHLVHRYFDTDHAMVAATVEHDLDPLLDAARRLLDHGDR
jgi:uncharacterized protein with HEPN domain